MGLVEGGCTWLPDNLHALVPSAARSAAARHFPASHGLVAPEGCARGRVFVKAHFQSDSRDAAGTGTSLS